MSFRLGAAVVMVRSGGALPASRARMIVANAACALAPTVRIGWAAWLLPREPRLTLKLSTPQLFGICVVIWGSTWYAITLQLGSVAPEISVGYRFLLASVVLFAVCRARGVRLYFGARQHADFALLGLSMFGLGYILVYHAETYVVSGLVAVGYSASPMLNMVGARVLFGTPMTARVAFAGLLGVAGICCVFWPALGSVSGSPGAWAGALLTAASVLMSSGGSMAAMRCQRRGYSIWASMSWGMLYGGVLSIAIGLGIGKELAFPATASYALSLVYLAVLGSIVTFACYLTLIARIGAARAAYVGVAVPIVALLVSSVLESFNWSLLTVLGVLLSTAGNWLILQPVSPRAQTGA